jgi:AcrR family transcriptional regulator
VVRSSNGRSLSRQARRRDARRGEILRAASRIFRDRGFAETGMRDIAKAADLSPANLYHYFRGKDEILYYCQDRALSQMLAAVAAARRGSRRPADRLAAILTAHVRTLLDDVEGAAAHLEVGSLSPALRARIIQKRDRYEHAVRRLVADGMAGHDVVRLDPAVVTRAMLGALNWTVTWFRPGGAATSSDVAATIAGYLVRGISNGRH